jgi:hypothetical protein
MAKINSVDPVAQINEHRLGEFCHSIVVIIYGAVSCIVWWFV